MEVGYMNYVVAKNVNKKARLTYILDSLKPSSF